MLCTGRTACTRVHLTFYKHRYMWDSFKKQIFTIYIGHTLDKYNKQIRNNLSTSSVNTKVRSLQYHCAALRHARAATPPPPAPHSKPVSSDNGSTEFMPHHSTATCSNEYGHPQPQTCCRLRRIGSIEYITYIYIRHKWAG